MNDNQQLECCQILLDLIPESSFWPINRSPVSCRMETECASFLRVSLTSGGDHGAGFMSVLWPKKSISYVAGVVLSLYEVKYCCVLLIKMENGILLLMSVIM